jgi:hypothetical protein
MAMLRFPFGLHVDFKKKIFIFNPKICLIKITNKIFKIPKNSFSDVTHRQSGMVQYPTNKNI